MDAKRTRDRRAPIPGGTYRFTFTGTARGSVPERSHMHFGTDAEAAVGRRFYGKEIRL